MLLCGFLACLLASASWSRWHGFLLLGFFFASCLPRFCILTTCDLHICRSTKRRKSSKSSALKPQPCARSATKKRAQRDHKAHQSSLVKCSSLQFPNSRISLSLNCLTIQFGSRVRFFETCRQAGMEGGPSGPKKTGVGGTRPRARSGRGLGGGGPTAGWRIYNYIYIYKYKFHK